MMCDIRSGTNEDCFVKRVVDYWLRRTQEVLERVESQQRFMSHRHHNHITDIAENAINVIMIVVESLSGECLIRQNDFRDNDCLIRQKLRGKRLQSKVILYLVSRRGFEPRTP